VDLRAEESFGMDQIGDYVVRRLIGEGGMGKVYEAEERLSKRRVALKVLHAELARSEEGRRLFLNEMQILARIEHPNVVRSLASTEVDGELVMVLEYLDGRTLRTALSTEGRMPWADAIRVVAAIAGGLAAAHGQDPPVIHRDLKPENIMLVEGGGVKVMDFGIAKVIQALDQTNTQSVGTLQYMSPEQIDAHTIDHRSDLYCLGLIFYELLAGRAPFQSASPRQLLNLQCTADPPPLPEPVRAGLPRGVEQLLFQLLEKAPEDRPYLADHVIERLEPFQSASATGKDAAARPAAPGRPVAPSRTPVRTPHRTPPAASGAAPGAVAPAASDAHASSASERPADVRGASAPIVGRADTIALLDRAAAPREVGSAVAVGVILALSALAGIGAYVLRSSSPPADTPTAGPTSLLPRAPPGTRQDRR
jgi:serine/threonine-protein kinase